MACGHVLQQVSDLRCLLGPGLRWPRRQLRQMRTVSFPLLLFPPLAEPRSWHLALCGRCAGQVTVGWLRLLLVLYLESLRLATLGPQCGQCSKAAGRWKWNFDAE